MSLSERAKKSFNKLSNSINRLEEALNQESFSRLEIDGSIQRFEFVFELFWKSLKALFLI